MTLHTSDKMGNHCDTGGAQISLQTEQTQGKAPQPVASSKDKVLRGAEKAAAAEADTVHTEVVDHEDGSYTLHWKSNASGSFKAKVLIDNEDVGGSPLLFSLTSSEPELAKTTLEGEGLRSAMAGAPASLRIAFVDQYGNTAVPGSQFKLGLGGRRLTRVDACILTRCMLPLPSACTRRICMHSENALVEPWADVCAPQVWGSRFAMGRSETRWGLALREGQG